MPVKSSFCAEVLLPRGRRLSRLPNIQTRNVKGTPQIHIPFMMTRQNSVCQTHRNLGGQNFHQKCSSFSLEGLREVQI